MEAVYADFESYDWTGADVGSICHEAGRLAGTTLECSSSPLVDYGFSGLSDRTLLSFSSRGTDSNGQGYEITSVAWSESGEVFGTKCYIYRSNSGVLDILDDPTLCT